MKSLKVFIIVVCVLLFTALGAGIYVWYEVQQYQRELRKPPQFDVSTETPSSQASVETVLE